MAVATSARHAWAELRRSRSSSPAHGAVVSASLLPWGLWGAGAGTVVWPEVPASPARRKFVDEREIKEGSFFIFIKCNMKCGPDQPVQS